MVGYLGLSVRTSAGICRRGLSKKIKGAGKGIRTPVSTKEIDFTSVDCESSLDAHHSTNLSLSHLATLPSPQRSKGIPEALLLSIPACLFVALASSQKQHKEIVFKKVAKIENFQ